ncbi:DUF1993 family protein [Brevundimonas sp.]|jgi:hypothetical protein|uniref:DUF1993 domain-containing protein n=1 Tax=Brevundimonas sp. TaxID=1871086 RepID=UPI0037835477
MAFDLYDASVPAFVRGLKALSALLDKALAQGFDEAALMEARLAPDMNPFPAQIRTAAFSARGCVARLTGQDWPKTEDNEATFAELQATIALSIAFIESVPREAFADAEDRDVVLKFPGGQFDFKGANYLTGFALPNFYFHVTTAYALLRVAGVEIGKRDYMGAPE